MIFCFPCTIAYYWPSNHSYSYSVSAWRHSFLHLFIHSTLAEHPLCAKHYARSWGPSDDQGVPGPCPHEILSLEGKYVNCKSFPLKRPWLELRIAHLLHPHCLSLSSRHLSLPWVTAAGLPVSASFQPPTSACTQQTAADRLHLCKHPFQRVTSLPCSTCSKFFSDSPISCQNGSKFLHHLARVKQLHEPIFPNLASLPLFPTCPSALSRQGLLTSLHTACSFLLCPFSSIYLSPLCPSEDPLGVPPPAGRLPAFFAVPSLWPWAQVLPGVRSKWDAIMGKCFVPHSVRLSSYRFSYVPFSERVFSATQQGSVVYRRRLTESL